MELVQIGALPTKPPTIREMFEKLAQREAEMVRAARRQSATATTLSPCEADAH